MTDYNGFKHGAATYPLTDYGSSFLKAADPALFYLLEFYAYVIEKHVGGFLMAEAVAVGCDNISRPVGEALPLNPEPYLTEEHFSFPLLAAYRKSSKTKDIGQGKHSVDEIDVCYILPPLQAGEAARLLPALKAVASTLDNRTQQGMDPGYTPTGTSTAGTHVWETAGVSIAEYKGATIGYYDGIEGLPLPCVVCHIELTERSDYNYGELEDLDFASADIDLEDSAQETVVEDFVQVYGGRPPPELTSLSPDTGTKQGGTSVTITGENFVVGTTPTVYFGGLEATSVVVASSTSITCVTPAHDAFTTFAADVTVVDTDGNEATLEAAFTFTSP